jgi:branched-chain amino acid transport system substrate-binding protein
MQRRELLGWGTGVLATAATPSWAQAGEIRIGVLTPLTGGGANYGSGMQRMYQLVADEINQAGGIGGRKIRLFTEDDQTNPDAGVRGARKLVDVHKVHAIVGTWSSAVTLAVAPIVVSSKTLLLTVSSSQDITTLKDDDLVFRTSTSEAVRSKVFATAALRQGHKRAALMLLNNPYGIGLGDAFAQDYQKMGGTVTARVVYNPNQVSYRTEIEQVFASKPDMILFGGYTPDGIQIFKEAFQLGKSAVWVSSGFAFSPQFIATLGAEATNGSLIIDAVPKTGGTAFKHAEELYRKAANKAPDLFVAMAYDHMMLAAMSILASKVTPSGETMKAALRNVSNPPGRAVGTWAEAAPLIAQGAKVNYEGASGSCDMDANGDTLTEYGIYQNQGGVTKLLFTMAPDSFK